MTTPLVIVAVAVVVAVLTEAVVHSQPVVSFPPPSFSVAQALELAATVAVGVWLSLYVHKVEDSSSHLLWIRISIQDTYTSRTPLTLPLPLLFFSLPTKLFLFPSLLLHQLSLPFLLSFTLFRLLCQLPLSLFFNPFPKGTGVQERDSHYISI